MDTDWPRAAPDERIAAGAVGVVPTRRRHRPIRAAVFCAACVYVLPCAGPLLGGGAHARAVCSLLRARLLVLRAAERRRGAAAHMLESTVLLVVQVAVVTMRSCG